MQFFIILYSVTFIFLFGGFFSFKIFKLLRIPYYFNLFLSVSFFITIIYSITIDLEIENNLTQLFLISYTVIYFGIFKLLDNYFLENYKRHLIFAPQYNYPFDEEAEQQSMFEIFLQIIISLLPFVMMYFLDRYLND